MAVTSAPECPLSLTIINGFPRAATMASSSRATRRPEIDVSTISARLLAAHQIAQLSTVPRKA
jgi:hypothetical protein